MVNKELMTMRTTVNISESILRETINLYNAESKSKAIENALQDAIRYKQLQGFKALKGKIEFNITKEDVD
jgi:Arc/MetJ family transcription regulator